MSASYVLFDFDGTLTVRDTTRYLIYALLLERPWRALFVVHLLHAKLYGSSDDIQSAKDRCIGRLIAGLDKKHMGNALARYRAKVLPLLRSTLVHEMDTALRTGKEVAIVSASPEFALRALFGLRPGLHLIATRFSVSGHCYSQAIDGEPCYGQAKVAAIRSVLGELSGVQEIEAAWSDSITDLPMMKLAAKRFWICQENEIGKIRDADPAGIILSAQNIP